MAVISTIQAFFEYIINLGPAVMMPIIITILGMFFGKKIGEAFKAGIKVGIGFTGLNLIIGLLAETITPVSRALVDNYGFQLTAVDIGWPVGASLAWGTPVVPFVFIAVLATNIIMLYLDWTKTMDVDIWNYWHALFIASILYMTTGNMIVAVLSSIVNMAIIFKVADWTQNDVEEVFGYKNVSLPHIQTTSLALIGYPLDWLLDRIPGIKNIHITPEGIHEKLGILGEPMMLGLMIGAALPAIALMPASQILTTAVTVAAVLVLLPKMVSFLMEGLEVISEGAQEFIKERFPERDLYIGLDSAVAIGHPFVVATALVTIPLALVIALILPGNITLPLADLSAMVYFVIFAIVPSRGNLFRGIITSCVFVAVILYFSSVSAPLMTDLAIQSGYDIPQDATQITALATGSQWYTWPVFWFFRYVAGLF